MPRTFEQIAYDAAYATGTLKDQVLSRHHGSHDMAKALVCYLARKELNVPFDALPGMVGLPDKTHVLKAFNRVAVGIAKGDPDINRLIQLAT
jgi:hypothetical protein